MNMKQISLLKLIEELKRSLDGISIIGAVLIAIFLGWDLLHARLNCHYEAWSYKKKQAQKG